jgi:hypothetical protein
MAAEPIIPIIANQETEFWSCFIEISVLRRSPVQLMLLTANAV